MRSVLITFFGVFVIFTAVQLMIDRRNTEALGKSVMLVEREMKSSELILYFFRMVICMLIAVYFIVRGGKEFQINLLIFAVLMGALAGKAFFPLIPLIFFKSPCGVYENGVVILRGTKLFQEIMYYSCADRGGEYMFAFVPVNMYLNRAAYFYVEKGNAAKVKRILSARCREKKRL